MLNAASVAVPFSILLLAGLMSSCASMGSPATDRPLAVPEDLATLDTWLSDSESRYPDMRPGVAKGIVWANPEQKDKTPFSIIYLTGYTATRGEMAPAPDLVARGIGANLFYTRLKGHGLGPDAHRDVTAQDWIYDSLEALRIGERLGDRVVVMACSNGGTLAAWLATGAYSSQIALMILASPNFTPMNKTAELLLWPGNELILKLASGDYTRFKVYNELQERYWDYHHHSHSLLAMMRMVDLARNVDFRKWTIPTLVFYDKEDQVVDESVTVRLMSRAPNVTFKEVSGTGDPQHHVLAGEAKSPGYTETFAKSCIDYIQKRLGG